MAIFKYFARWTKTLLSSTVYCKGEYRVKEVKLGKDTTKIDKLRAESKEEMTRMKRFSVHHLFGIPGTADKLNTAIKLLRSGRQPPTSATHNSKHGYLQPLETSATPFLTINK